MVAVSGGGNDGKSYGRRTTGGTKDKTEKSKLDHLNRQRQNLVDVISRAITSTYSFVSQNDLALLPTQTLILESLLSSSSHSLNKLLSLLPKPTDPLSLLPSPPPPLPLQPQCWFHRFLSSASSCDSQWFHAFHMSKLSFTHLLNLLSVSLSSAIPKISPDYTLAAALFRLAHGANYKALARRFGIDSEEVCRAFYVVCKAVNENLGHLFEFRTDLERIVVGFGWSSFPNCVGVLGLVRFGIDGELLGNHGSLMVQALVDSEGRFLDVSAGWPSTMKPETILHQSKLYLGVEESRELLHGPPYELSDGHLIPQYVLGESCFPLLPWLLTPYNRLNEEDSFSSAERAFNSAHNDAMGLVGTAFGRLRARWQLLSKQWKQDCLETLPFVIVAGCLLHNFLIKCREPVPVDDMNYLKEEDLPVFDGMADETAQRTREALASHLSRVSLKR
ncbi:hypothetical protein L6164_014266 [Bauhinia variegata]|uniref:Uncharacterized protein n=1 Tax=Bauhinia variegata TaxID=167791 RepID=A0ACB9NIF7_BAUVA|nr:hypothetical protein L6164_014266 [Bauhinia variegata]